MNWTAFIVIAAQGMLWLSVVVLVGVKFGQYTSAILENTAAARRHAEEQAQATRRHTDALLTAQHYELAIHEANRKMMTELLKVKDAQAETLRDPMKNAFKESA